MEKPPPDKAKGNNRKGKNRPANPHPLLNHVIMSNVLNWLEPLSFDDLRNIRAVCPLWNEMTYRQWRERVALRVGPSKSPRFNSIPVRGLSSALTGRCHPTKAARRTSYMPVNTFITMLESPPILEDSFYAPIERRLIPFSGLVLTNINLIQGPGSRFWTAIEGRRFCDHPRTHVTVDSIKFKNCILPGNPATLFYNVVTEHLIHLKKLSVCDTTYIPDYMETRDGKTPWTASPIPSHFSYAYLEINGDVPQNVFVAMVQAPQLETLILRNSYKQTTRNLELLYNSHVEGTVRRRQWYPSKIKHLDVMESLFFSGIQRNLLIQLTTLRMPLEYLSLTLEPCFAYGVDGERDSLHDIQRVFVPILRVHRKTLKILKLFRPPVYRPPAEPLFSTFNDTHIGGCMDKLEELHIWGNVISGFSFLMLVPNLRLLYLNPECVDKKTRLLQRFSPQGDLALRRLFLTRYLPYKRDLLKNTPMCMRRMIHCDRLVSLHLDTMITSGTVTTLAVWMPNLKKFWSVFDKDTFRTTCRSYPMLEVLGALLFSTVDDDTITGCGAGDNYCKAPNLTMLGNLKTFELKARCYSGLLTDKAAYNGFLKMNSLETLNICVSPKFSRIAEEDLKNHIPKVTIVRNYDDKDDWDPKQGYRHGDGECCQAWNLHQDLWGCW